MEFAEATPIEKAFCQCKLGMLKRELAENEAGLVFALDFNHWEHDNLDLFGASRYHRAWRAY